MSSSTSLVTIVGDPEMSHSSTDHAEAVLWLEILQRTGILRQLPRRVAGQQGWGDGQMLLTVLLLTGVGYERISDVEKLEEDRGLCWLVRDCEPKILDLSSAMLAARFRNGRTRTFPPANAVHEWLAHFHNEAAGVRRVPKTAAELQLIEEVNQRLIGYQMRQKGLEELTLDLDATVLPPGKRKALPIHRNASGEVSSGRGCQPFVVFCPELGMVPGSEFRDGNVPASVHNVEVLQQMLAGLSTEVKRVWVRSDGAVYPKRLIRFCNDPASRQAALQGLGVIGFVIDARRHEDILQAVAQTSESCWSPTSDLDLECADLNYVSPWGARQGRSQLLRYVGTRRALPGELGIGLDEILAAQGRPAYRVHAYLTNLTYPQVQNEGAGRAMTAAEVVNFAHERCRHSKKIHSVIKEGFVGSIMPSKLFGANAAWWHLAVLSANVNTLLQHFKFKLD